jgi:serine/threonine protein phosphatase PrpC
METTVEGSFTQRAKSDHASDVALRVVSHGATDKGQVRAKNEDQFAIAEVRRVLRVQQSSLTQPEVLLGDQLGHLLVVADGMGGHRGGEVASAMAVMGIENLLLNTIGWLFRLRGDGVLSELRDALKTTDRWVEEAADRQPELQGMGTTITLAYMTGRSLYVAHVGDSRCYLLRNGHIAQLTRDHTLVDKMVSDGLLTPEQAATHAMSNIVTNAVGGGSHGVQPEVHKHALTGDDVIILCTDGLYQHVSDEEIGAAVTEETSPADACQRLVALANARGGTDNITALVVRFDD